MISMGFLEILPFVLSSKKDSFENFNIKGEKYIPLGFSAESSINIVGNWIIPKLFKALTNNQHKSFPQKLFACDYVVVENKHEENLSENKLHLASVIANSKISFTEISSYLLSLTNVFGKTLTLKPKEYPFYIKGRSAAVFIDGSEVGHIGEFSPEILENHNYTMPVCGFEIDFS
jgi:phenylalanyl-tRNA synthetase beta chain